MEDNNKWIIVSKKTPSTRITSEYISRDDVITILKKCTEEMTEYFESVYLHGSTSTGKHTENSDIDIVILWKNEYNLNKYQQKVCETIKNAFNKKVDIANLIICKSIKQYDKLIGSYYRTERARCFLDLVDEKKILVQGNNYFDVDMIIYANKC